jgi:subtilisin family serine protease
MKKFQALAHAGINWESWLLLLILSLFLVLSASAATGASTVLAPRAQPSLLALAATQPDVIVDVIVQKAVKDGSIESLVTKLGGRVTKDLHIINAFAAELQAKAIPPLARAAGVRWVSLDSPVQQSAMPIDTSSLKSAFVQAVRADAVWNEAPGYLQGQGMTVAVVDSGVCNICDDLDTPDGKSRVLTELSFSSQKDARDFYGHGSLVAGIMGASSQPITWGSVNWNSVNWNSVNWNSVNWNSVNWNSVNWNSDYWGP